MWLWRLISPKICSWQVGDPRESRWCGFSQNASRLKIQKSTLNLRAEKNPSPSLRQSGEGSSLLLLGHSVLGCYGNWNLSHYIVAFLRPLWQLPVGVLNEANLEICLRLCLNLGLFNVILYVSSWQFWLSNLSVRSLPLFLPVPWESSWAFCRLGILV